MSPEALFAALLRRWYVLVLAMLLTAAGAHQVLRPEPYYQTSAVVVVKLPATDTQPNQLTNLQPAIASVSYQVVLQLRSPAGREELRAAGVDGEYRLSPRNSGTSVLPQYLIPSLQIEAESADRAESGLMVRRILTVYNERLREVQRTQGTPAGSRMSAELLSRPGTVELAGITGRALVGVALLGGFCGVLVALWADRLLLWRAHRPHRREREPGRSAAAPRPG